MSALSNEVFEYVRGLAREFPAKEAKYMLMVLLIKAGLYVDKDGFDYLLNTVLRYREDPTQSLTKELYPAVAKMYKRRLNGNQVERCIRTTIEIAWKNQEQAAWFRYFSPGKDGKIKKPSNGELISAFARVLDLWEGCCQSDIKETDKEDLV